MAAATSSDRLSAYLDALCSVLGHADRAAGLRGYCSGLMLPLERKSVEPLAAHLDPTRVRARHQALHHFVAKSEWSDAAVLSRVREYVSARMDLKTMAISRLMLDNFPHIKAYWIMLGVGTAQTALAYGADDLDGTVRHELIYHDAGATTPQCLTVDTIGDLIRTTEAELIGTKNFCSRTDGRVPAATPSIVFE
jgi:2-iminoacetate synthase ThiH